MIQKLKFVSHTVTCRLYHDRVPELTRIDFMFRLLFMCALNVSFRSIIGRDVNAFKHHVFEFLYAMPLIAVVNSLLKVRIGVHAVSEDLSIHDAVLLLAQSIDFSHNILIFIKCIVCGLCINLLCISCVSL